MSIRMLLLLAIVAFAESASAAQYEQLALSGEAYDYQADACQRAIDGAEIAKPQRAADITLHCPSIDHATEAQKIIQTFAVWEREGICSYANPAITFAHRCSISETEISWKSGATTWFQIDRIEGTATSIAGNNTRRYRCSRVSPSNEKS